MPEIDDLTQKTESAEQSPTRIGEAGQKAMQGPADAPSLDEEPWTAADGSAVHAIYARRVEEGIEAADPTAEVRVEEAVGLPGGGTGRIDTRIDGLIVDYKTHDMKAWTPTVAARYGNEHGQQLADYVDSPDTPDNARAVLIAAGREADDSEALETYVDALRSHGVEYRSGGDANPEDVLCVINEVRAARNAETDQ